MLVEIQSSCLIFDAFGRLMGDNNNSENNFGGGEGAIRYESPRPGSQVNQFFSFFFSFNYFQFYCFNLSFLLFLFLLVNRRHLSSSSISPINVDQW